MALNFMLHHIQVCLLLVFCLAVFSETCRSYYESLYVEPTATAREINQAFRKLAIKYHPDKNKSFGAEKKFLEIAEAHRVLSNKKRKSLYDTMGHKDFLQEQSPAEPDDTSFYYTLLDRETEEPIDALLDYWSDLHYSDESFII